jgi:hypothetical protein
LPKPIKASLLDDSLVIDDIDVANNELIVVEMKISFEKRTQPYVFEP